jgi:hypothetical protein
MARVIISDGASQRTIDLVDTITVVGRSSENRIAIDDKQCSRRHCHFEKTDYGYKLVDLESRNGTRVNDRVVNQALLRPGDRVQIGKHVLTFEDPAFREPPPDVAARFAPAAAAAAPAAPAPASAAAASVASAPAPAPAEPLLPADPGGPALRRRTGHTTSINRIARVEQAKEKQLITIVGVGAAVFVVFLLVLMFLPSGGESPAAVSARKAVDDARKLFVQGKLDEAQILLGRVPTDQKEAQRQAQALLKEIDATRQRKAVAVSAEERRDFDELYDFCEKNRANPRAFDTMVQRCESFKQKYPRHAQSAKVDEWIALGSEGRKSARRGDLAESERQAQEALKKDDYATAIKTVKGILDKYRDELEVRERLVKLQDEIIDKAKGYSRKRNSEANDAAARGRKDEAIKILEAVVLSMGDGNVEELADYALLARTTLQSLK